MTTTVYEVSKGVLTIHVTKDGKKTICGKKVADLEEYHLEMKKDRACPKCWAKFS